MKKIGDINIVTVITQEGCKFCTKLKEYLVNKKIAFIEQDFDKLPKNFSRELFRCRKENNIKSVGLPLWIYKGELHEGFGLDYMNKILGD